jgi:alpha-glucosidase (family GH31 glycosyl hydrolase)
MRSFGSVREVLRQANRLRFRGDEGTLELEVLTPRIVRLRLRSVDDALTGHTVALLERDPGVAIDIQEGDPWTIRTAELIVEVRLEPLRIVLQDTADRVLLQSAPAGVVGWERVDDGRRRVQARFQRASEEHYYGLGQAGPSLDKDGTTRRLWNSHYGHGPGSDMAAPLVVSSRGYGLFFDNSWDAEVSLGRNDERNTLVYTAEGGQLDWYFLAGPRPKTILAEYARLTGYPPMPPRWALGYIQSTRHFESPDEIVDLARTLRNKQFPCDAMVFLSTYGEEERGMNNGVGTLEFHPRLWANAEGVLAELKDRHLHVVSHEYPVISPKSPKFEDARRLGYLVDYTGSNDSVMFNEGQRYLDFTNPAVGTWWWEAHKPLVDLGIDGWWLDGGEGPPSTVQLHAGPGRALHNTFDLFRQQAFAEGERHSRPERRPWLLCRSGYAGMQRLGAGCWSGDIDNTFGVLEAQVPLGLSTAMSGVPYWGTDIGGFFHRVPETGELFVRWFQFAAFCPIFRSHGRGSGRRGWREHLPWAHGPEVEQICRAFSELRYRLFPYNYSLAWEAHTHGTPLMRPLVLEYPDDPNVVDMGVEYLWGPSLLTAPVTKGGASRWPVYLPHGDWYDFWTQQRYGGGQWLEVAAPLERMPLFVRSGAIIPLGPAMQHVEDGDGPLTVLIYPEGTSTFELYEDDGESRAYESGGYAVTNVSCAATEVAVRLSFDRRGAYAGMPADRSFVAQVYLRTPPSRVTVASKGVVPRRASLDTSIPGWWHDGERFLWIGNIQASDTVEIRL